MGRLPCFQLFSLKFFLFFFIFKICYRRGLPNNDFFINDFICFCFFIFYFEGGGVLPCIHFLNHVVKTWFFIFYLFGRGDCTVLLFSVLNLLCQFWIKKYTPTFFVFNFQFVYLIKSAILVTISFIFIASSHSCHKVISLC